MKKRNARSRTKPRLTVALVLRWADAHHARMGRWPSAKSGTVKERPSETWRAIGRALEAGVRGFPGGSSLPLLLKEHRGTRHPDHLPRLTVTRLLKWADAFRRRTGRWPKATSGQVAEAPHETWCAINQALSYGRRGLPGGSSLARLLARYRGRPNPQQQPRLTYASILRWADTCFARTGSWPTVKSGPVQECPGTTWRAVHSALMAGARGLPGGTTLPRLLAKRRGARSHGLAPPLTLDRIIRWADAHYRRTGRWPTDHTGPVAEAPEETWRAISMALTTGRRGLPGGSSLARVLTVHRGKRHRGRSARREDVKNRRLDLTVRQILIWADDHHRVHRAWPRQSTGAVRGTSGETWARIDVALRNGSRGLAGRSSLARLLADRRGVRNVKALPELTVEQVLRWADAWQRRTGRWPLYRDGRVTGAPGETWGGINCALDQGLRELPGGSSLVRLLAERRGARNRRALPPLAIPTILTWADNHRRRHGVWPQYCSGPIRGVDGETWSSVDTALRCGTRGLPGGSSLARLLARHRGLRGRRSVGRPARAM